ncbi:hypothetical protein SMD11_1212 [Streptomyces albireticuli]|uniref:Uncharacterized protein n=1 Tax=Streptomyces albireticuli TaxID=1940 RepID=A0A1Z2KXU0_9ACTN|nr:hypothetical protein SMD11_1212 [Streptomyces albireticuli]
MRAQVRRVWYKITSHPDVPARVSGSCLGENCKWSLAPTAETMAAGEEMMKHTAATGHNRFQRFIEDEAVVSLTETGERMRRTLRNDRELVEKPYAKSVLAARARTQQRAAEVAAEHARAE